MAYRPLSAVVLAAGEGTRMRSSVPKMLHPLCGRPMLLHVLDTLAALPLERLVIVVGHGAERVTKTVHEQLATEIPIEFVEQRVQRGTGDAASVGLTAFADTLDADDDVLVLTGDVPLLRSDTLAALATEHRLTDAAATMLTVELEDPTGYGRIVRDERGGVLGIVEQADANDDQLGLTEVNPSIYCFRRAYLAPALRRLSPENAQGEYYLTDVVSVLRSTGHPIVAVAGDDASETMGVNDRAQLAAAESVLRARINDAWMREGVGMTDPTRTYIDMSVELEPDVQLLPGVILEGRTAIGAGSVIGPDCRLVDTIVGERVVIQQPSRVSPRSVTTSRSGRGRRCDPARTSRPARTSGRSSRPRTPISARARRCHTSPTSVMPRSGRAPTSVPGRSPRTTTASRSTARRWARTPRVGSNTVLVAPVEVGDGAYTGAGAIVSHDVPPGALAKGVPARVEEGWAAARAAADDGSDEPT